MAVPTRVNKKKGSFKTEDRVGEADPKGFSLARFDLWIHTIYNSTGGDGLKYSKATNYALHTMLFLVVAPEGEAIGVQSLAQRQRISPTYLSKVLSKLVKAGLIESATGVNGGYTLIGPKEKISFLNVIEAIEGQGSLFNCGLKHTGPDCLIDHTMSQAESLMEQYLEQKKLVELARTLDAADLVSTRHNSN